MFVFEVLIYAFFAWVMYGLARKSYICTLNTNRQYKMDRYLWMFIGFYVLICAVRYGVGVDSIKYASAFKHGEKYIGKQNEGEFIWNGFISIIAENGIHFTVGMAICAFLQILPIVLILRTQKHVLRYLPIVLFGSMYFLILNNGVRQMIVACWFLYATKWIVERKILNYIFFILISLYIHSSSIVLVPLYFLYNVGELSSKRKLCISILLACLVIGVVPQFQLSIGRFEDIMEMIGYDSYTDRMAEALLGENENKQAFGLQKMSYFISFFAITYFGKELNETYKYENKYFNIWWFYGFCYGCLYFLIGGRSYLFQRPLMYIVLFSMIMISYLLKYLKHKAGIQSDMMSKFLIVSMWLSISWQIIKAMDLKKSETETVTYKTIINHDIK